MEGYGVDIDAPEPPFVLFQVLYRILRDSFLGTLLYPFYFILSLFVRTIASVFGYFIGFLFGDSSSSHGGGSGNDAAAAAASSSHGWGWGWGWGGGWGDGRLGGNEEGMLGRRPIPVSQDDRIPKPDWGPDLSMMNDEYL